MTNDLAPFFSPRGVALIGASPNPEKISYNVLQNLTHSGYQGVVYPVNPRYSEIMGMRCYTDVTAVPEPVDLAVIVLPTRYIPEVLRACGRRGIKAATIVSSGFKEVGRVGEAIEAECLAIARQYGMRLIGPNCVGTIDLATGLNTTFIEGMPDRGCVGFVSQSGGVCGAIIGCYSDQGIGFSRCVSLGNEADVTETDVIEFMARNPDTRVIAAYVEGISDGRRFMEVVGQVSVEKPVIVLKAGRTRAGEQAVASHTGALAGSMAAYRAGFRRCGVIEARSLSELLDTSLAFAFQPLPAGDRVFVLSNSGGPAALSADHLDELGVPLAELSPHIQASLREGLDPAVQIGNPIDMLGGAGPDEYEFALPVILSDPAVDIVLVILVPHLLLDPANAARRICRVAKYATKPIVTCFVGGEQVEKARQILHQHRLPMYHFPEAACGVVNSIGGYVRWRNNHPAPNGQGQRIANLEVAQRLLEDAGSRQVLGEAEARPVFNAYHVPIVSGGIATSEQEAIELAEELGYPVALKLISPDILHKTEAGGVKLGLKHPAAVVVAYRELVETIRAKYPEARLDGVLVEMMANGGYEVIVGVRRDPQFGPLLMFGMGGVYVELLTDVAFRIAPVSRADALEMIQETKAGQLLSGLRGQVAGNVEAVAGCIEALSQMALDFPQIREVEINPLLVSATGAVALDGRIVLEQRNGT